MSYEHKIGWRKSEDGKWIEMIAIDLYYRDHSRPCADDFPRIKALIEQAGYFFQDSANDVEQVSPDAIEPAPLLGCEECDSALEAVEEEPCKYCDRASPQLCNFHTEEERKERLTSSPPLIDEDTRGPFFICKTDGCQNVLVHKGDTCDVCNKAIHDYCAEFDEAFPGIRKRNPRQKRQLLCTNGRPLGDC